MHVILGVIAGIIGFLPLVVSANLARKHPSTGTLSFGLFALGGVAVSLVVLIVAAVICAAFARDGVVAFILAEIAAFLVATIVYVLKRNQVFKHKAE